MAQPQGGLNAVMPQQAPQQGQAQQQAGKTPDVSATAGGELFGQDEEQGFDASKELQNLAKGRAELDAQIRKMQESLARRQQVMVDPRWAAFTAAVSAPTKTGSAFESLGAGLGAFSDAEQKDLARQAEIEKMNAELLEKRVKLQQQIAGQGLLNKMFGPSQPVTTMGQQAAQMTPVPGGPGQAAGQPAPAGQVPGQAVSTPGYSQFRPINERDLMLARQIDPDTEKFLMELRRSQIEAQKAAAAGYTKVQIPGTGLEVNVPIDIANQFFAVAKQSATQQNPELLTRFMAENGMIQAIRKPSGEYETPKTSAEQAAEKETATATAQARAKAAEDRGNALLARGENALKMESLASDVISMTEANTRVFQLMQDTTIKDSVLRAVEQGASAKVGSQSVDINLPVRILQQYKITPKDLQALQLFQQKQAEITAEMRRAARVPGEGATDRAEGQLYAAIGILNSDSARVLALKSEALIQKARYDSRAAQLWAEFQEKNPGRSFTQFQHTDPAYKELQKNYVAKLTEMRERNADLLRTSPKAEAPKPEASKPEGAKEAARGAERTIGGKVWVRQSDGSWRPKQ